MKWSQLKPAARYGIIAAGAVAVVGIAAGAVLLSGGAKRGTVPVLLPEITATVDATATTAVTETAPGATTTGTTKQPTPVEPSPTAATKAFGKLKGIRDESSGSWTALWVDMEAADFLTGGDALAWLIQNGDQDFYNKKYWYARPKGAAVTSFKLPSSNAATKVSVVMYTWPVVPSIGFYGPDMTAQKVGFGEFYDAIYMDEDSSQLLNRYYWFTVTNGVCTKIEEQPRDPYYEP